MNHEWRKEWHGYFERTLTHKYPGATMIWDDLQNPTLCLPDNLEPKAQEIIEYLHTLWRAKYRQCKRKEKWKEYWKLLKKLLEKSHEIHL